MTKYLDDKPFSTPTTDKPMSAIKYDLRVLTEKEFRKKYKGTSKWAYDELCRLDQAGFVD